MQFCQVEVKKSLHKTCSVRDEPGCKLYEDETIKHFKPTLFTATGREGIRELKVKCGPLDLCLQTSATWSPPCLFPTSQHPQILPFQRTTHRDLQQQFYARKPSLICQFFLVGNSWRYLIDGNWVASRLFWEFFHTR